MTTLLKNTIVSTVSRYMAEDQDVDHQEEEHHDEHHAEEHNGVHIEYKDLYSAIVFLAAIYVAGQISSRILRMPNLVGEIVAGIVLGPELLDFVPNAEAWVMLGEIGLVLLVVEAGIDIDVSTLKLIGTRGFLIAIIGSILPIGLGIVIAVVLQLLGGGDGIDAKAAIAAGATFGPTSLGIALNILRGGGVLNTPVGQLIISAAVIDDMIALIVLSQLEALTGEITVGGVLIPIVSAVGFLVVGGFAALFVLPPIIDRFLLSKASNEYHGKIELFIMFVLLVIMMPATYHLRASYLMGAFLAGLTFCTSHELHHMFVVQFKRMMQWLMRIFFAASIGFQVPITDFASWKVLWQGLVYSLALMGKLLVGFMVPNFTQSRSFTNMHLRDCLITGFSMAAEGEFAFVIAVFAVDNGLIDEELYASVVLAVLLSTILPPFLLRYTISHYNKKAEAHINEIAGAEMELSHMLEAHGDVEAGGGDKSSGELKEADADADPQWVNSGTVATSLERNDKLVGDIRSKRAVFLCIQTQSDSAWGLLHTIMHTISKLGLDIIDHRSFQPRGINTTLVNEIYVKDSIEIVKRGTSAAILEKRMGDIHDALIRVINQKERSKVKVQRWYPGVVEEIIEDVDEKSKVKTVRNINLNVERRLLEEASRTLDQKHTLQLAVTKERSVREILADMSNNADATGDESVTATTTATVGVDIPVAAAADASMPGSPTKPQSHQARRRRQKMRSTPVVGGGLFGETAAASSTVFDDNQDNDDKNKKNVFAVAGSTNRKTSDYFFGGSRVSSGPRAIGYKAEIIVGGETYDIRINDDTLKMLQTGYSGDWISSRGVAVQGKKRFSIMSHHDATSGVVQQLQGYVRSSPSQQLPLSQIQEEQHSEHGGGDYESSDNGSSIHHRPNVAASARGAGGKTGGDDANANTADGMASTSTTDSEGIP